MRPDDPPAAADYSADPRARRAEWHRYYSAKRIGHQWLQVALLAGLEIESVLEIGPYLGLVSALLDNAGYRVTTLDLQPAQYPHPRIAHRQGDLRTLRPADLGGFDGILCCETLEHLPWDEVDRVLALLAQAGARHLVISVPYEGFQIAWRFYLNWFTVRSATALKKFRWFKTFRPGADPHGHRWELGYRGFGVAAFEAKLAAAGLRVRRREFSSPTRSVFYLLDPAATPAQPAPR